MTHQFKVGDKIKIISMFDCHGKDKETRKYNGRTGEIEFIDGIGQLHGTWGGLAVDPVVDKVVHMN